MDGEYVSRRPDVVWSFPTSFQGYSGYFSNGRMLKLNRHFRKYPGGLGCEEGLFQKNTGVYIIKEISRLDYEYDCLVRPNSCQEFVKSLSEQISRPSSCLLQELLKIP